MIDLTIQQLRQPPAEPIWLWRPYRTLQMRNLATGRVSGKFATKRRRDGWFRTQFSLGARIKITPRLWGKDGRLKHAS